ncbi:helix-turn-helix domain-containing protein [Chryseolinea soli]|uniref:Helix-turn-helix domain-containing protein n=1 Tax=Chryseolinea soli TaxID=2321403 RepID=A0A385SU22_9BACT|nr:AraC family transcriptional regulator [Chryseolinea soli]AYB35343.1 helix-turn-helix domain-containing protein [Chryseolinea soli]
MKIIPIRHIKASPKEPDLSEGFSIRDVRALLAGKDMVQELHRHDFFYILALKKGAGHHEIDFTPYKVCDHSVFMMRPGQVHQHTLKAGSTGYLMGFGSDFYHPHDRALNQPLRKASAMNLHQLDAARFNKLFPLLTHIFQEYTDKQEGYGEVIKANLAIFFIELVRQQSKVPANQGNTYAQERLEDFLELLETHITAHKQVAQYSEMMNLSAYQLNAITKATLGKTCSELINEHIILESKRYLLATSNQVNQIAYHLGYEDVSYFIRFFKKHTGQSPETFRHNFK